VATGVGVTVVVLRDVEGVAGIEVEEGAEGTVISVTAEGAVVHLAEIAEAGEAEDETTVRWRFIRQFSAPEQENSR